MRRLETRITLITISSVLLLGSALSGCGQSNVPEGVQRRVHLKSFMTCSALEQHIEDAAVEQMERQLDAYLPSNRSPWDGWGWGELAGGATDSQAAPNATGGGTATKSAAPAAHTTTNNQVAGVNEPDFVKNDGTRIFVLSGQRLYATKSWPPSEMQLAGELELEGRPTQMFLDADKNRVVVLSTVSTLPTDVPTSSAKCGGAGCGGAYDYYGGRSATKITVVDVSQLTAPKITNELYVPGSYVNARRVGSAVRVVLRDYLRRPQGVVTYPNVDFNYDYRAPQDERDAAYETALLAVLPGLKAKNEELIRAQSLDDWLPDAVRKTADGSLVNLAYDCSQFHHSNASVELGLATVTTLDLDQPDKLTRTSVIGQVGEIYASAESLYLTNHHWWWRWNPDHRQHTYVHKFDISDPSHTSYVASGAFEGHILDQFALDEHNGYLRAAVTLEYPVAELRDDLRLRWRTERTNRVTVLAEEAGQLNVVGNTPNVAKGERIYSARFVGDKGYVVTFRQVDPLFTIDLANPRAPRIAGELKVPGFSTYIHPLDDNHLLTIGTHIPEPDANGNQPSWQERHLKLTIFDVSDFANPKEKFTEKVGTFSGSSEALYEHKAFNYFPERGLLAIPFTDYMHSSTGSYWDQFVSEVRVFDVSANKGISHRGSLSVTDVYREYGDYGWTWYYRPEVRRSVMATDDAGTDFVYAISDGGIRAAGLGNLATPEATVKFPRQQVTDEPYYY